MINVCVKLRLYFNPKFVMINKTRFFISRIIVLWVKIIEVVAHIVNQTNYKNT
jgi:hypothetical protein